MSTLAPPSRLKGMETRICSGVSSVSAVTLAPPSRLKGMETFYSRAYPFGCIQDTLAPPSRLKGMETLGKLIKKPSFVHFGSAFPFEGNGNSEGMETQLAPTSYMFGL